MKIIRPKDDEFNEEREIYFDGILIGSIHKTWARMGGEGWTAEIGKGQTYKTMKAAARELIKRSK